VFGEAEDDPMTRDAKPKKDGNLPFDEEVKKAEAQRSPGENERIAEAEARASERKAAVVDKVHGLAR